MILYVLNEEGTHKWKRSNRNACRSHVYYTLYLFFKIGYLIMDLEQLFIKIQRFDIKVFISSSSTLVPPSPHFARN